MRELYERCLCVQALRLAQTMAPIRQWNFSPAARLRAGRLAANLGAPQLAAAMHYRAFREFPEDPEVRYYYARLLLDRRGPLPAREFLRSIGDLPDTPTSVRAHRSKPRCVATLRTTASASFCSQAEERDARLPGHRQAFQALLLAQFRRCIAAG